MTQFDTRNILDRIEVTWNTMFSSQTHLLFVPLIFITFAQYVISIGIIAKIFDPTHITTLDIAMKGEMPANDIILLILSVTGYSVLAFIFYTLFKGLVTTYVYSFCHNTHSEITSFELFDLAWKRLWGWMAFYFWMGLLWISIIIVFSIGTALTFGLFIPFGIFLSIWIVIIINTMLPGYIIKNSFNPSLLIEGFRLTRWRWWRVFGNGLLVIIALAVVGGVIQSIITGVIGTQIETNTFIQSIQSLDIYSTSMLQWYNIIIVFIKQNIIIIVSIILLSILANLFKEIFSTIFSYIIWKDLTTEETIMIQSNQG